MILILHSIRSNRLRFDHMYVCLCKAVTDRQIHESIGRGAVSFAEVRRELGVATQCGKCCQMAKSIVETAVNRQAAPVEFTAA